MHLRLRSAALTSAMLGVVPAVACAHAGFTFQKSNSIDLSSIFTTGGALGSNPISVAFDGTTAWVGGLNGAANPAPIGVLRVNDVFAPAPTLTPLAGASFTSNGMRGFTQMAAAHGNVFLAYNDDAGITPFVRKIDGATGGNLWQVDNPAGARPFAMAIDPRGGATEAGITGVPGLRFMSQDPHVNGSHAFALRLSDGAVIYGNGSVIGQPGAPAFISAGQSAFTSLSNRDMAFDESGNLLLATGQTFAMAMRDGNNSFINYNIVPAATGSTGVLRKQEAETNVEGIAAALIPEVEGTAAEFMAVAMRAPTDALSFAAQDGSVQNGLDARHVFIRKPAGALPDHGQQAALNGAEDFLGAPYTGQIKDIVAGRDAAGRPVFMVLSFADRRLDVYQIEPGWGVSSGDWDDPLRWATHIIADGPTQNARFNQAPFPMMVALNSTRTTKLMRFGSSQPYTIAGNGTLTLDAPSGVDARVIVFVGNHTIAVPVVAAKATRLQVAGGHSLTLSGGVSGAEITKHGGGPVSVKRLEVEGLDVAEGTVRMLSGESLASRLGALAIAHSGPMYTATVDLTDNGLIVSDTPVSDLRAALLAGRAGGAWNGAGLSSTTAAANNSIAAVGYATAGDIGATTFVGVPVIAGDTLIRYTRLGDADLSGVTDIGDFARLAASFNSPGEWSKGDFDFNGLVGIGDFALLAANFNQAAPFGVGRAVPEPAGVGALLGGLIVARRRR